ncbi:MAG: 16S rRNA processing protein RimM [Clostridiales bacterium]|jgi:16S rRNA processing protein RimM|nr:16S rRNA processing protein RimM [Clostridiales bacterium]
MLNQFLEAGKIVGTHGVKGELRVQPWCDSAEFLAGFKTLYAEKGARRLEVVSARVHKNLVLLKLKGIDTPEQGDLMRGKILYLDRGDVQLAAGQYFIQDLMGLDVYDADTFIYYGKLTEVMRTGANDVYQVTSESKKNHLIPAIQDVIKEVNMTEGKMIIRPLKGIFDDED